MPQTFLITGATSGFGLALTRLAQSNGHIVIGTCRNPSAHPELHDEITSKGGRLLALDVTSPSSASLITDLDTQGIHIDVFISCAGSTRLGPAESFTEEEVRTLMETFYFGPYRLIRAIVPGMRERRRGCIVNISTGAAVDGREGMGIYGASKAALDTLVKIMAKEVSPFNVRVLTVYLGTFDTKFASTVQTTSQPVPQDYDDSVLAKVLAGIVGTYTPDGDHRKAVKVIYDMIVGERVGEGKEGERVMPLGRDTWPTMERAQGNLDHTMATFKEICHSVYLEK